MLVHILILLVYITLGYVRFNLELNLLVNFVRARLGSALVVKQICLSTEDARWLHDGFLTLRHGLDLDTLSLTDVEHNGAAQMAIFHELLSIS